jgi:hypothetical protein
MEIWWNCSQKCWMHILKEESKSFMDELSFAKVMHNFLQYNMYFDISGRNAD